MIDVDTLLSHFATRQLQESTAAVAGNPAFETKRVLRWVYLARLVLAAAIYLAALFVWLEAEGAATLIASLSFIASMWMTVASFLYTHIYHRAPGTTFRYGQSLFDLLLVTAVVHITGGSESQFAALYILVIAGAALLHEARGVVLITALGLVLYFADALFAHELALGTAVWLQLALFSAVAVGSGLISARLRTAGVAREKLAAELAQFRLREPEVQRLRARAERLEGVAQMSASLAHEIKNPLAAIRSAVEQLADGQRADADERSLAGLVTRESDRLSRLLSEFLDFARVELGKRGTVDLRDVIRDAVRLEETHPDRRDSVAIAMILPDRPLLVEGDRDVLHRAVFNLLLNAVQVSPDLGAVVVEAEELSPRQTPAGEVAFLRGSIAVRVSDQGPGVPPGLRDRVFDPFFTTKERGTGLGLAIVQRAVTAHGGHVIVEGSERGARFTVLLPRPAASQLVRSMHG